MDPVIRVEMMLLIQEEQKFKEELEPLEKELPTWKGRVKLAQDRNMPDLARQAAERVEEMELKIGELRYRLEALEMDKATLRKRNRMPTGAELRRAEALLESFRESGLVDPEEASLEREFAELRAAHGVSELKDADDQ